MVDETVPDGVAANAPFALAYLVVQCPAGAADGVWLVDLEAPKMKAGAG